MKFEFDWTISFFFFLLKLVNNRCVYTFTDSHHDNETPRESWSPNWSYSRKCNCWNHFAISSGCNFMEGKKSFLFKNKGSLKTSVLNFLIISNFNFYMAPPPSLEKRQCKFLCKSHPCPWKRSVRILSPWSWSLCFFCSKPSFHPEAWMFYSAAIKWTLKSWILCKSVELPGH